MVFASISPLWEKGLNETYVKKLHVHSCFFKPLAPRQENAADTMVAGVQDRGQRLLQQAYTPAAMYRPHWWGKSNGH
jgi:hypothetical protein